MNKDTLFTVLAVLFAVSLTLNVLFYCGKIDVIYVTAGETQLNITHVADAQEQPENVEGGLW